MEWEVGAIQMAERAINHRKENKRRARAPVAANYWDGEIEAFRGACLTSKKLSP